MKTTKKSLIAAILSFVLIFSLLVGSTAVYLATGTPILKSSSGDDFNIDLFWSEDFTDDGWKNVEDAGNSVALSSETKWQPGYSEVRYFKIDNPGNVDFTYEFGIRSYDESAVYTLGDVIKVYISENASSPEGSYNYAGTLNDCFQTPRLLTGDLTADASKTCAVKFLMDTDAGNEYQSTSGNKNSVKFDIWASATAPEPEPEPDKEFGIVLPNYESYLYRVGNENTVAAKSLFYINENSTFSANRILTVNAYAAAAVDSSKVNFTITKITGTASGTFTPDTTNWENGTFKFNGEGVVKVEFFYDNVQKAVLNLEVVTATNVTSASSSIPTTSKNVVMLDDIKTAGRFSVTNHTLYGNGYSVIDNRSDTSRPDGFVNLYSAVLDNVEIIGREYPELVESGITNNYYSPCVYAWSGKNKVLNSHIAGCKNAIMIASDLYAENSVFEGGSYSNVEISKGDVTFKDCKTTYSSRNGLKGLAVMVSGINSHFTIEGSFVQNNWIQKSELPSSLFQNLLGSLYNDSQYAYTQSGKTYINTGVLCFDGAKAFTLAVAQSVITDNTGNTYGFYEKSYSNYSGTCYMPKSSTASAESLILSEYNFTDQYPSEPKVTADYTVLNFIPKTEDSNTYCYYDSITDSIAVSYETTNPGFNWNPMILTITKYGKSIDYTVSMNGIDYTNKTITFTQAGEYKVIYSYQDTDYYHGRDALKTTRTYTRTENITVTTVDPEITVYHPEFKFITEDTDAVIASTQKVISNVTYVMPDITQTSSSYGSTSVGGTTVYYPIVKVSPSSSDGDAAYSKGKGYYFAPAFSAVNIKDLDMNTGSVLYTYNSSSTTWPHGKSATTGPDGAYFGFPSDAAFANKPYGYNGNEKYYKFAKNSRGLCYTSNEFEHDIAASNHLVHFHYVGNDGVTYHYFIQYSFEAFTFVESSTCFAEGTQITLADGTQKPIEKLAMDDEILSRNFFTGKCEAKKSAMIVDHGKDISSVVNLEFSDGSLIKVVTTHGIFDYDLNDFVYINSENCSEYIGHRFAKHWFGNWHRKVKLTNAYSSVEEVHSYSIASVDNLNAYADGILTMTPPAAYYNWIEKGSKLKFDLKSLNRDIEKYGLYSYEDFSDYLTEEQFEAFKVAYCKVAVGRGIFTFDYILELIENYGKFFR